MDKNTGYGSERTGRDQFTGWIQDAPPDDAIHMAKASLKRVAMLPKEQRDRFLADIGDDPVFATLLEEARQPA